MNWSTGVMKSWVPRKSVWLSGISSGGGAWWAGGGSGSCCELTGGPSANSGTGGFSPCAAPLPPGCVLCELMLILLKPAPSCEAGPPSAGPWLGWEQPAKDSMAERPQAN